MDDNYKFVGVVNLFSLFPDFLYPVYEKDNELYFHNVSIHVIDGFDPLSESAKNRVVLLDSKNYQIINSVANKNFHLGSFPVYAFQESEKVILCFEDDDMYRYLKNFKTDDILLARSISFFCQNYIIALGMKHPHPLYLNTKDWTILK